MEPEGADRPGLTPAEQAALDRRLAGYARGKAKAMKRHEGAEPRARRPTYQRPTLKISRGLQWFGIAACVLAAPFTGAVSLLALGILLAIFGLPNREPCPHCGGRVKIGMAVCRHCGRDITWN